MLTINEISVIMAIFRLGNEAYGVRIKNYLMEITKKDFNYGTMYCMLDQLVKKGFLRKVEGEPTPERGGRRKIFYRITADGLKGLKNAHRLHEAIWNGFSETEFEKGTV